MLIKPATGFLAYMIMAKPGRRAFIKTSLTQLIKIVDYSSNVLKHFYVLRLLQRTKAIVGVYLFLK